MSLELSPGFFDARMAMSDDDDDALIPQSIDVENLEEKKPTKIVFVEFINLMFVNQKKDCGCGSGGWSRTKTY
ncbi:hypothetical protein MT325_M511L [Paramecium bursaria chlorella virus MT325]|uniref:Uncharacterized protein M511L n=1 Tax=Paramecium bursaria Chlorella virus MT325 TaxID=346932 RepID=A7IUP1_PBCVM|nr:hypothetical protein MT325_M511L [Paramecium bursaria chlorella virus MT325]AGE49890.1 hypothetical protein PBCVCan184_618L [Paramecium bursaria Chlorella virus Can18-4]AGE58062.1 hypothetical protein PBCVNW6652_586L [Paramecium bursaria Chlorella virus NW665.2]